MDLPNIVYIHSHDTGRYVQPYGHAVPTPNIQAFAEQGVLFRQAFTANPTCSPSRAALLTGMSPHCNGMTGLAHRGWGLNDYRQHIIHTVKKAGHRTAIAGHQHIAKDTEVIGYDEIIPTETLAAADVSTAAAKWLREHKSDEPFWLSVGFIETHRGFPPHEPADDPRYSLPPAPLPDNERTRRDMADFKSCVRQFDHGVGKLVAALDRAGLADNTLVICTTDHGIAFPGMKCNLTDHGIGVMLVMRGPGGYTGGKVIDGMVSQIDIFPTICELLGLEKPDWLQGKSFQPLVAGDAPRVNEEIFAEVNYHAAYEPQRCVRTERWKYIRRFLDRPTPVVCNTDGSPSRNVWMEHGFPDRPVAKEQLYDLLFDPNEGNNLAGRETHASVLEEMRERLHAWMEHTNDPLLKGDVPAPPGATVNEQDSHSSRSKTRSAGRK